MGKKVTQIFNPRPGRESNWGPQDWEAEILTTAPTPSLATLNESSEALGNRSEIVRILVLAMTTAADGVGESNSV